MFEKWLDRTILFSFDRSGFLRHQRSFQPERLSGSGKHALISGAAKGIGLATAQMLTEQGAHVDALVRKIPAEVFPYSLYKLDLGDMQSVYAFSQQKQASYDILIHNAGSMPNLKQESISGYEEIFASQVIGPYVLTRGLIESGQLQKNARVIFVSSGGMYLKPLDLTDVNYLHKKYRKYEAYANAKRAQVILTRLLNEEYQGQYSFHAMHPGWVNTAGVIDSMPWFYRLMRHRLRTVQQGADTIVWLALTQEKLPSGCFWFDRQIAPETLLASTKPSLETEQKLWDYLDNIYRGLHV